MKLEITEDEMEEIYYQAYDVKLGRKNAEGRDLMERAFNLGVKKALKADISSTPTDEPLLP